MQRQLSSNSSPGVMEIQHLDVARRAPGLGKSILVGGLIGGLTIDLSLPWPLVVCLSISWMF